MQFVLAECSATFAPGQTTASVRFIGDERMLTGLEIVVPQEVGGITELKSALKRLGVQAMKVQQTTLEGCTHYLLDVAELDGSDVSRERWAALQGTVLNCIIGASISAVSESPPRSSWRAFRDMLQKATPRVSSQLRRHA